MVRLGVGVHKIFLLTRFEINRTVLALVGRYTLFLLHLTYIYIHIYIPSHYKLWSLCLHFSRALSFMSLDFPLLTDSTDHASCPSDEIIN